MLVVLDLPREGAAGLCRCAVQCLWTSTAHGHIRTTVSFSARFALLVPHGHVHTRSHNRCPNKEMYGRVRASVSLQYAYLQMQVCACARACTAEQREVVINRDLATLATPECNSAFTHRCMVRNANDLVLVISHASGQGIKPNSSQQQNLGALRLPQRLTTKVVG